MTTSTDTEFIRLVRASATVEHKDGTTSEAIVSLRIPWTGFMPDHACTAASCVACQTNLTLAAERRTRATVVDLVILSDGQRRARQAV